MTTSDFTGKCYCLLEVLNERNSYTTVLVAIKVLKSGFLAL